MQKHRLLEQARPSLFPFSLPPPPPLFTPATQANLSRVFGPAQIVKCRPAISPGVEFLRTLSRFKKRKENLSSYLHFLHKTSH